jgi:hypothetical protein
MVRSNDITRVLTDKEVAEFIFFVLDELGFQTYKG